MTEQTLVRVPSMVSSPPLDRGIRLKKGDEELSVGLKVWVPHSQFDWQGAQIIELEENNLEKIKVLTDSGEELYVGGATCFVQNPSILEGVDDMTTLSYLHEPAILHNLATRYGLGIIYTYTGSILIAVNPYQKLHAYTPEMINAYCGQPLGKLSPHVYAISEDAYRSMLMDGTNQSILVSGESGAGKTETTKFLLQYFAAMGEKGHTKQGKSKQETSGDNGNIEKRVLESTPLLEAFGNAKTIRNDNSSRFGKFIEIQFDAAGVIVGAKIRTYLLEKSRIVRQTADERNYHIFYQLVKGASEEERKKLKLLEIDDYHYTNQSGCTSVEESPDEEQFQRTREAMNTVGISEEEQDQVFYLLAAVLALGNIEFEKKADADHSDACQVVSPGSDSLKLSTGEAFTPIDVACSLLGCDKKSLEKFLINKHIVAGNESYDVPLSVTQASTTRDALSMLLYSRMFDWLVQRINDSIQTKKTSKSFIGVLDIYGFEMFENNSFEQLCINYANEKLQQQFNQHIFKLEQQEYEKEKIDWSYIQFADNQDCLDLLEKKPLCILSLLDEQSIFPKATAQTLAEKFHSTFHNKPTLATSKYYDKPRWGQTQFVISHYAGRVTYDTESFIDKNKDFIVPEHIAIMEKSSNKFVKSLFANFWKKNAASTTTTGKSTGGGGKSTNQFVSVGSQFRDSLGSLMESIRATSPHYVRCIKPNSLKKPLQFDQSLVLQQLRSGGVLECIRISKAGYPTRKNYESFFPRYQILAIRAINNHLKAGKKKDNRVLSEVIIQSLNIDPNEYQFGLTKIFLRAGQIAKLEKMRSDLLNRSAVHIQRIWKGWKERRNFAETKKAALQLQCVCRMLLGKQAARFIRRTMAATKIQSIARMFLERKVFVERRRAATILQNAIRGTLAQKSLNEMKQVSAVIVLQKSIRAHLVQNSFQKLKKAALLAQTRWRGKLAYKQLTQLRIEARSIDRVIEQKNQLEKKVDELDWKLSAEVLIRSKLEKTIERKDKELENYKKLSTEQSKLEQVKKSLQEELEDLKKQLEESRESNKVLQQENLESQQHWTKRENELNSQLNAISEQKEQELKALNDQFLEQQEELKKQFQVESEQKQKEDAEIREKLQKRIEELEKDNEKLKNQVKTRDSEVEDYRKKVLELEENLKKAQTAANNVPGRRSSLPPKMASSGELTGMPESVLRCGILKAVGNDEDKANRALIGMLANRVLTNYRDEPYSLFCNSVPVPAFVIFRTLMLDVNSKNPANSLRPLDDRTVNHICDSVHSVLKSPIVREDLGLLSFWLSSVSLTLYLQYSILGSVDGRVVKLDTLQNGLRMWETSELNTMQRLEAAFGRLYSTVLDYIFQTLKPFVHGFLEETKGDLFSKKMTTFLSKALNAMIQNMMPPVMVQFIFTQVFRFISATAFNEVVLRRDLCTMQKGLDIKMRLAPLKQWARKPDTREWLAPTAGNTGTPTLPPVDTELEPLLQVLSVLTLDKTLIIRAEIRSAVCPDLNAVQLKQVLSLYQPAEPYEAAPPLSLLRSLVALPEYKIDDPLCRDSTSILSVPGVALGNGLTPAELQSWTFPRPLLAALEGSLNNIPLPDDSKSRGSFLSSIFSKGASENAKS